MPASCLSSSFLRHLGIVGRVLINLWSADVLSPYYRRPPYRPIYRHLLSRLIGASCRRLAYLAAVDNNGRQSCHYFTPLVQSRLCAMRIISFYVQCSDYRLTRTMGRNCGAVLCVLHAETANPSEQFFL